MAGGRYRPIYVHKIKAGLDARRQAGRLAASHRRPVDHEGHAVRGDDGRKGVDPTSVEGASNLPYAIPDLAVDLVTTDGRRAGAVVALGRLDAYGLCDRGDDRRAGRTPRARTRSSSGAACSRTTRATSACSSSRRRRPAGARPCPRAARGVAVHEIVPHLRRPGRRDRLDAQGGPKVERVVCAVDCGVAVNPDIIRAQMEGGIGFGLGAILHGAINLDGGGRRDQLRQLRGAAHRRDAEGRGAHRAVGRAPDRGRRARRAADRAGGRQRLPRGDRQAGRRAALRQGPRGLKQS